MDTWVIVVIAIAAVVVVAAVVYTMRARAASRRRRLSDRFGPEYERALERSDDRRAGERELEERLDRHEELELRPLDDETRARYAEEWMAIQARFVDEPAAALREADRLVRQLLAERGYPASDFERAAADVSVEHPATVERYRSAHGVVERMGNGSALAVKDDDAPSLDDLRGGLVDYRALVEDLLKTETPERAH